MATDRLTGYLAVILLACLPAILSRTPTWNGCPFSAGRYRRRSRPLQGWFWSSPPAQRRACAAQQRLHRSRQRIVHHMVQRLGCMRRMLSWSQPRRHRLDRLALTGQQAQPGVQYSFSGTARSACPCGFGPDGQGSSSAVAAGRLRFQTSHSYRQTTSHASTKIPEFFQSSIKFINTVVLVSRP